MTYKELKAIRALLQWAQGKAFTVSVMDKIEQSKAVVDREIALKELGGTVDTD